MQKSCSRSWHPDFVGSSSVLVGQNRVSTLGQGWAAPNGTKGMKPYAFHPEHFTDPDSKLVMVESRNLNSS